jgi:hypothetical protein
MLLFVGVLWAGCGGVTVSPHISDAHPSDGGYVDSRDMASAPLAPTVLPLTIKYQTAEQVALTVPITIGATTVDTVFDTGSSGLRILPGALAPSDIVANTMMQVTETYASGVQFVGHAALAQVSFGAAKTPKPIPVMIIDVVQCAAGHPNCNAAGFTADTYQIKPDASGHGYRAIIGTGMHCFRGSAGICNPIVQLAGHPAFAVRIPGGYGASSGTVEIGPTLPSAMKTLQLPALTGGAPLADGSPSWNDWALPICVADKTSGAQWCSPGLFDTGAGPTLVYLVTATSAHPLPAGDEVTVTATGLGSYAFTVGSPARPGLDEVTITSANDSSINVGTGIFYRDDVYFDQAQGLIGVVAH